MRLTVAVAAVALFVVGVAIAPAGALTGPSAERTVDETTPEPGDDVRVTLTVELEEAATVDYVETIEPAVDDAELTAVEHDGETVLPAVQSADADVLAVLVEEVPAGTLEIEYALTIPDDAAAGTSYGFDPVLRVGAERLSVAADSHAELTVAGDADGTGGDAIDDVDADDATDTAETPDEADDDGTADGVAADGTTDGVVDDTNTTDGATTDDNTTDATPDSGSADGTADSESDATDEQSEDASTDDELPGFGVLPALGALGCLAALRVALGRRD